MKIKRTLKSLAALMCAAVMAVSLAACSDNEEVTAQLIMYTSEPAIGIMGDGSIEILMAVIDDYDNALKEGMGGD